MPAARPMDDPISGPSPLDIEDFAQLEIFLRTRGVLAPSDTVSCTLLTGGVSNRTVRVAKSRGPNLVVKQALAKLRVSVDWYSAPERIHREFAALDVFGGLLPDQVPQAYFQDRNHHVIAMSEIPQPHHNWKSLMMQGQVEPRAWVAFGQMLAHVHRATGQDLVPVPAELYDRTYFETLRLEPYYLYSGRQVPAAQTFLEDLVTDTRARQNALVHGDYSPKNILVHNGVLHLLDFEVCHAGDPAFDVGFALTHALGKAHWHHRLRHTFLDCAWQFWQAYGAAGLLPAFGPDMERRSIRHATACLLARAAGRSPLEYLDEAQRARQVQAAIALAYTGPASIQDLLHRFASLIAHPAR